MSRGWGYVAEANRFHYFDGRGVPLCGLETPRYRGPFWADQGIRKDCCRACRAKIERSE